MKLTKGSEPVEPKPLHAAPVAPAAVLDSRRRPGRTEQVSPHLIPLPRSPATVEFAAPQLTAEGAKSFREDLPAACGIGVESLLSVPAWAVIGLVTWALLRRADAGARNDTLLFGSVPDKPRRRLGGPTPRRTIVNTADRFLKSAFTNTVVLTRNCGNNRCNHTVVPHGHSDD